MCPRGVDGWSNQSARLSGGGRPRATSTRSSLVFRLRGDIVDVDVGGAILFGRCRDWGRDTARAPTPTLSVRAYGLFGTADVWRVPSDVRGTYGEVIAQIEARQRELPA
jgi:hypothetical protein